MKKLVMAASAACLLLTPAGLFVAEGAASPPAPGDAKSPRAPAIQASVQATNNSQAAKPGSTGPGQQAGRPAQAPTSAAPLSTVNSTQPSLNIVFSNAPAADAIKALSLSSQVRIDLSSQVNPVNLLPLTVVAKHSPLFPLLSQIADLEGLGIAPNNGGYILYPLAWPANAAVANNLYGYGAAARRGVFNTGAATAEPGSEAEENHGAAGGAGGGIGGGTGGGFGGGGNGRGGFGGGGGIGGGYGGNPAPLASAPSGASSVESLSIVQAGRSVNSNAPPGLPEPSPLPGASTVLGNGTQTEVLPLTTPAAPAVSAASPQAGGIAPAGVLDGASKPGSAGGANGFSKSPLSGAGAMAPFGISPTEAAGTGPSTAAPLTPGGAPQGAARFNPQTRELLQYVLDYARRTRPGMLRPDQVSPALRTPAGSLQYVGVITEALTQVSYAGPNGAAAPAVTRLRVLLRDAETIYLKACQREQLRTEILILQTRLQGADATIRPLLLSMLDERQRAYASLGP